MYRSCRPRFPFSFLHCNNLRQRGETMRSEPAAMYPRIRGPLPSEIYHAPKNAGTYVDESVPAPFRQANHAVADDLRKNYPSARPSLSRLSFFLLLAVSSGSGWSSLPIAKGRVWVYRRGLFLDFARQCRRTRRRKNRQHTA